jgi:hypothetical protein
MGNAEIKEGTERTFGKEESLLLLRIKGLILEKV